MSQKASVPEWLTSNTKIAYPFLEQGRRFVFADGKLVVVNLPPEVPVVIGDNDFRNLFVDAYLRYAEPVVYGDVPPRNDLVEITFFDYNGGSLTPLPEPVSLSSSSSAVPGSSSSSSAPESESSLSSAVAETEESLFPAKFDIILKWVESGETFLDTVNPPEDTALDFRITAWGSWVVIEWIQTAELQELERVVKLVLKVDVLEEFEYPLGPIGACFLSSLVEQRPDRLRTLISTGLLGTVNGEFQGRVGLEAGYNVRLATPADDITTTVAQAVPGLTQSIRETKSITVNVEGGAGLGRFPICLGEAGSITEINGVPPDAGGNVNLTPKTCYKWSRTRPFEGALSVGEIQLFNDCDVCCDCPDYVEAYNSLKLAHDIFRSALEDLENARLKYECLVDTINELEECLPDEVKSVAKLYVKHGWLVTVQCIAFNNTSSTKSTAIFDVEISSSAPFSYVSGSGYTDSPNIGRVPVDASTFSTVIPQDFGPGTVAMFEFEIYFPSSINRSGGVTVSADVTGSLGSSPFVISTNAALLGPLNK